MIRFWVREIFGWCLVLLGLYIFLVSLALLLAPSPPFPKVLELPAIVAIGIVVFRGGIHLLKVAVAARVCMQAQVEARKEPPVEIRPKKPETPWDW